MINENCSLYSMPLNLEPGKHTVTFSGDLIDTIEFVIGDTLETPETVPPAFPLSISAVMVVTPIIWIICFIVFLPVKICQFNDSIQEWIDGKEQQEEIYWIYRNEEEETCKQKIINPFA